MSTLEKIFLLYVMVINVIGFALMGIDKKRARKHQWRIPEKTLFLVAVLLGSIGTWAGMCFIIRQNIGILCWECR